MPQGQYDNDDQQRNKDAESKSEDETMALPQQSPNPRYLSTVSDLDADSIRTPSRRCNSTYTVPTLCLPDIKLPDA